MVYILAWRGKFRIRQGPRHDALLHSMYGLISFVAGFRERLVLLAVELVTKEKK